MANNPRTHEAMDVTAHPVAPEAPREPIWL
jgi:hypothetical protein